MNTKKVLLGVGIGCGSLVLLGLIALGAGAWWVKRQVGDSMSSVMESGQKMQQVGQELGRLNKSHPFTPPKEGEVLLVSEPRLLDYLAVREKALPVYAEYEKQAKALEDKSKGSEKVDVRTAMQAASMTAEMLTKVQEAYIEGLKQHQMSPREFRTLTQTLYTSFTLGAVNQAQKATDEAREEALQGVRKKLEDDTLTDEQRAALQEEERQLEATAQEQPEEHPLSEASKKALAANTVLLEKYKERLTSAGSLAMDALLVQDGDDGAEAGTARDNP